MDDSITSTALMSVSIVRIEWGGGHRAHATVEKMD